MYKKYCPECNKYSYSASRVEEWYCSHCHHKLEDSKSKENTPQKKKLKKLA